MTKEKTSNLGMFPNFWVRTPNVMSHGLATYRAKDFYKLGILKAKVFNNKSSCSLNFYSQICSDLLKFLSIV